MEEKAKFQSDILYDLPLHQEFSKLTTQTYSMNILFRCLTVLCVLYFLPMLQNAYSRWLFLVLCGVIGIPRLLQLRKHKKGDLVWEQTLHRNNGEAPRQLVTLDEAGIRSRSLNKDQEIFDPYDQITCLMESQNLLLVMTKLRMVHVIDKRTLTGGSLEALIDHLYKRCPKLKQRIRTGRLHRIVETLMWAGIAMGLILSLAYALHIPQKLSGQITNDLSYREMAAELAELGIHVSDTAIEELESYDAENRASHLTTSFPLVLDLLCWEGQGVFEEVQLTPGATYTQWTPSTSGVFWISQQVYERINIYTHFLDGISAMDSSLVFSNVKEDYSDASILDGSGDVSLSFDYLATHYQLEAEYNYDWFDTDMIYHLGRILAEDEDPNDLWMTTEGDGILFYYGTEEEKTLLEKKTGIVFFDCVIMRMGH